MIDRIKAALGWLAGSLLAGAIILGLAALPVAVVLWIGSALGVPWADEAQLRLVIWTSAALVLADRLLPGWAWFAILALLWLAFLDLHVRWLVRDELSKQKALKQEAP